MTYVIRVRDGGPSSGYISSGFFGGKQHSQSSDLSTEKYERADAGLVLGRVALLWVNEKVYLIHIPLFNV